MRILLMRSLIALSLLLVPVAATTEEIMIESFELRPETRWRLFTDGVMGGLSTGGIAFREEVVRTHAQMTGTVSTENNGGFIQMRMDLPDGAREGTSGVRLFVRGNNQEYFIHLRTNGTVLPWQYYQAGFEVTESWSEVRLPLTSFKRSGRLLHNVPLASSLTSIGIVAFGRDHEAEIDIREVGIF